MTIFFTPRLQQQLKVLGTQAFADDPKVAAIIANPADNTTFYITEYRIDKDMFFGYVKSPTIQSWGSFPVTGIQQLYQSNFKVGKTAKLHRVLNEPAAISELLPEMKPQIANARLARIATQRPAAEKGQEPEREL